MSESKILKAQDEFFSTDVVEGYYQAKLSAMNEMQAQVVIDTLKDVGKLCGGQKLGTLLDVGSGSGIVTSLIASYFERAIGIDLSANQIDKARKMGYSNHIEFKTGNAESLPIADGSVDVITCVFSLQCFDLDKFLQECRRVLKPDGMAIFYIEFLSSLTSLEDDSLPPIVDRVKEMRKNCMAIAQELSHPECLLLDDFQAIYDMIDWPEKRRITREAVSVMKLAEVENYFLSIPIYAQMDPVKNPVIRTFKDVESVWRLGVGENNDTKVRVVWDAAIIVLS